MPNPAIKNTTLSKKVVLEKKGAITPAENQAAAIVLQKSDKALSWPPENFLINFIIQETKINCQFFIKLKRSCLSLKKPVTSGRMSFWPRRVAGKTVKEPKRWLT